MRKELQDCDNVVPKQSNKKVRVGREQNCSCVMFFRLSLLFPLIVSADSFYCNISNGIFTDTG